jgi:hypothetical protein
MTARSCSFVSCGGRQEVTVSVKVSSFKEKEVVALPACGKCRGT